MAIIEIGKEKKEDNETHFSIHTSKSEADMQYPSMPASSTPVITDPIACQYGLFLL